jgi:hypothetical protein
MHHIPSVLEFQLFEWALFPVLVTDGPIWIGLCVCVCVCVCVYLMGGNKTLLYTFILIFFSLFYVMSSPSIKTKPQIPFCNLAQNYITE